MELMNQKLIHQGLNRGDIGPGSGGNCPQDDGQFQVMKGDFTEPVVVLDFMLVGQRAAVELQIQFIRPDAGTFHFVFQLVHEV